MRVLLLAAVAASVVTTPALAVTNLLTNGSFEAAGATGPNAFTGWNKLNTPDNQPSVDQPASVIRYGTGAPYPAGAYGEAVSADNAVSGSPDAVGNYGAYFVGDLSDNETIYQDVFLNPGNYRVGFSYYLTANGLANPNNSSLSVTILGIPVANTMITSSSLGKNWLYASGVGQIQYAGTYRTALVFNSNGMPAKDVVVDRVFGISTLDAADVIIPPAPDAIIPAAIPEPSTWAMLLAGFGLVGFGMRRRSSAAAA